MTSELKPCPFCGGEALIGETLDDTWFGMCGLDNCCVLESYWPTKDEAIAAWNTRVGDTQ